MEKVCNLPRVTQLVSEGWNCKEVAWPGLSEHWPDTALFAKQAYRKIGDLSGTRERSRRIWYENKSY